MHIIFRTKKGEHALEIDANKIGRGLKKAGNVTGNTILSGVNGMLNTAREGLDKASKATAPSAEFVAEKAKSAEERAKIKAEIQRRKAEIKALEGGL